jgi:hypothetical protein
MRWLLGATLLVFVCAFGIVHGRGQDEISKAVTPSRLSLLFEPLGSLLKLRDNLSLSQTSGRRAGESASCQRGAEDSRLWSK